MIEFAHPWMVLGSALAAIPLLLHLAHWRRRTVLRWAAMALVRAHVAAARSRMRTDDRVALSLRMVVIAAVALALARPAWRDPEPLRTGRVAAVLAIDDSLSTTATGASGRMVFTEAMELATAYVATLRPGDEVAVVRASALARNVSEPLYDLAAAQRLLEAIHPTATHDDHPALMTAALDHAARSLNPEVEVVAVGDGAAAGWHAQDPRWNLIRDRLDTWPGTRPRVMRLIPAPAGDGRNLGIISVAPDRECVGVDQPVRIRVGVSGVSAPGVRLRVSVQGEIIDERPLGPQRAAEASELIRETVDIPWRFSATAVVVEARIIGQPDRFAADDTRAVMVHPRRGVRVLLVADAQTLGLAAVQAALDPLGDGRGLFIASVITPARLSSAELNTADVVVLIDPPPLPQEAIVEIERRVGDGMGLLLMLGHRATPAIVAREWWRSGAGILPAAPLEVMSGLALTDPGDEQHPMLAAFQGPARRTLAGITVRRWWRCDPTPDAEVPLRLDNGALVLALRAAGAGRVALLTTGPEVQASDFAAAAAWAPLVRGVVGHIAAPLWPPTTLQVGQSMVLPRTETAEAEENSPANEHARAIDVNGPDGRLELNAGYWDARPAWITPPLLQPGIYRSRDQVAVVQADAEESRLDPSTESEVESALGSGVRTYRTRSAVTASLAGGRRDAPLWPWLVGFAIIALLGEAVWVVVVQRREAAGLQSLTAVDGRPS